MAKIVLTSFGTMGDMFPFLRVGQYLHRHGHEVVFATSSYYADLVYQHGLIFAECGPSEETLKKRLNMSVSEILKHSMHPLKGVEFAARNIVLPTIKSDYAQLLEICKNSDLLISHVYSFAAPLVSQKLNLAWTNLVLQPMALLPTHDPSVLSDYIPIERFARWIGPTKYAWLTQWFLKQTNSWFRDLWELIHDEHLEPLRGHPFARGGWSPSTMYALFDPVVWRNTKGLPDNLQHCGYSHWDGGGDIPEATLAWLNHHPKPLIFTLGSSAVHHAKHFYEAAIHVSKQLNEPAILLAGEHTFDDVPDSIHILPWASHRKLFPYGSVIIHQGGSGTCSNALFSGCPQIIYAFGNDQPDNAQRLQDLGVAIRKTSRYIDADDMCASVRSCLHDDMLHHRAKAISKILYKEDGAFTAAKHIMSEYLNVQA